MPQEWLAIIREYGGDIKETYGVPVEEISDGHPHGVRKVNIDTDIRLAMTGAMRRLLRSTRPSSTRASRSRTRCWRRRACAARVSRRLAAPGGPRRSARSHSRQWAIVTRAENSRNKSTDRGAVSPGSGQAELITYCSDALHIPALLR